MNKYKITMISGKRYGIKIKESIKELELKLDKSKSITIDDRTTIFTKHIESIEVINER